MTSGVNKPPPLDQVTVEADPPNTALSGTATPTHSTTGVVTATVAASLIVKIISSDDRVHGPAGSSEVMVKVTLPEAKSAALGVYVAFNRFASSKVPVPEEDHEAELAEPPIVPFNVKLSSEQMAASAPAEITTVSFKVMSI